MDFDELFQPPENFINDYAAMILGRIFGPIVGQLRGENTAGLSSNVLVETLFGVFNTFCLIAMLVVLSYTIYSMVFDTAADGKVFGQNADTKYTIVRVVLGVVAFIPVVGSYSMIQIAFIWLLLQGSALADSTWRAVASHMVSGSPMMGATPDRVPPEATEVLRQYGAILDTLVTGHICAGNGNAISESLSGDGSAITLQTTNADATVQQSSSWISGNSRTVALQHQMWFEADAVYSGRNNFCGAVSSTDSYVSSGSNALQTGVLAGRQVSQFRHHAETILPALNDRAREIAYEIVGGSRDSAQLLSAGRQAVLAAAQSYLTGPGVVGNVDQSLVDQSHELLLDTVNSDGWMMAPVWLRGVAQSVATLEAPGHTLTIDTERDNALADYLAGRGGRSDRTDAATRSLLAKADADQDFWDSIASGVRSINPPDVEPGAWSSARSLVGPSGGAVISNAVYQGMLSAFSPEAASGTGNFGFADPMLQVQRQGAFLAGAGTASLGAGVGLEVGTGNAVGRAFTLLTGTDAIRGNVTSSMMGFGITLIILGTIMMVVIPLVPMVYFFTAALSWFWQVLETMFALPLAVLALFAPQREGVLIGTFSRAILAVFGVFMRPFFMIAGLFLAMLVISVALGYLHLLFSRVMFFDPSPAGSVGGAAASSVLLGAAFLDTLAGMVKAALLVGLYVLVAFLTVLYGSQIISELGDRAMELIGSQASRYTQTSNIGDRAVLAGGLGYMGARGIGQRVQSVSRDNQTRGGRNLSGPTDGQPALEGRGGLPRT